MQGIQFSDFVEVFNCRQHQRAMLVVMTVWTVLKVPFEKAAPPCPSDVPASLPDTGRCISL